MKQALPDVLERGRVRKGAFASSTGDLHGAFVVRAPGTAVRYDLVILSSGEARERAEVDVGAPGESVLREAERWEHVSVSVKDKRFCPSWDEMSFVKDLFWDDTETVVQFHPHKDVYVSKHKYTLHLWKPPYPVPTPPMESIGVPGLMQANLEPKAR